MRRRVQSVPARELRVFQTRGAVRQALIEAAVPLSAQALQGNLSVDTYDHGFGFRSRTEGEIQAALVWLVRQGLAVRVVERDPDDPPGALYLAKEAI